MAPPFHAFYGTIRKASEPFFDRTQIVLNRDRVSLTRLRRVRVVNDISGHRADSRRFGEFWNRVSPAS
jgi:hypothetical protein